MQVVDRLMYQGANNIAVKANLMTHLALNVPALGNTQTFTTGHIITAAEEMG